MIVIQWPKYLNLHRSKYWLQIPARAAGLASLRQADRQHLSSSPGIKRGDQWSYLSLGEGNCSDRPEKPSFKLTSYYSGEIIDLHYRNQTIRTSLASLPRKRSSVKLLDALYHIRKKENGEIMLRSPGPDSLHPTLVRS